MPYECKLLDSKYYLFKKGTEESLGSHKLKRECTAQMRAIYANELSRTENIQIVDSIESYRFPDFEQKISFAGEEIHVVINSRGGDFDDAIDMHQKLRNSGKQVIVHINPRAFSAGAVLALAGDKIYMPENGLIMFHKPKAEFSMAKDAVELESLTNRLKASETILVNTLMSKTKKSREECEEIMNKGSWLTAEEAKKIGIVDEIMPILRRVEVENYFPERIVNFIQEKEDMPLKELCDKFGAKDESELENLINDLKGNQKPRVTEPSANIINMVKKARESELNSLVHSGKALPAEILPLKTKYCEDVRVKNDCMNDSGEFDAIIDFISKREGKVINFDPKTGEQVVPDPKDTKELGKKPEEQVKNEDDILVRRMKEKADRVKNEESAKIYG